MVIAIVSVLAALLLPALEKAQEAAYTAGCLNQLKQCGLGWSLYTDEHEGRIQLTYNTGWIYGASAGWPRRMLDNGYLPREVMGDPYSPLPGPPTPAWGAPAAYYEPPELGFYGTVHQAWVYGAVSGSWVRTACWT